MFEKDVRKHGETVLIFLIADIAAELRQSRQGQHHSPAKGPNVWSAMPQAVAWCDVFLVPVLLVWLVALLLFIEIPFKSFSFH